MRKIVKSHKCMECGKSFLEAFCLPFCSMSCKLSSSPSERAIKAFEAQREREVLERTIQTRIACRQERKMRKKKRRHLERLKKDAMLHKARAGKAFYDSDAWQTLRYRALKTYGRVCALCRATDVELHVDHIVPRSVDRSRELDFSNLQVLCKACNLGKGNSDSIDWRQVAKSTSEV